MKKTRAHVSIYVNFLDRMAGAWDAVALATNATDGKKNETL